MNKLLACLALSPVAAWAEPPNVVTDIAPVHSLVAQVMGDVGTPDLLLPPGADPHDFAMRPSEAQQLTDADVVIWVGHGLTPWLEDPLAALAPQATQLVLLESADWASLPVRDMDDHHDDHDDEDADDHDHDHGDTDPHGWLDPVVARAWLAAISTTLGTADPDNADIYARNAGAAAQKLTVLEMDIAAQLAPLAQVGYILPHDGYQYFEHRFGLEAAGAISGIDGRDPGPALIAELQAQIAEDAVACVFSDLEVTERWAALVADGTGAKTAHLDGTGAALTPGPALYDALLRNMADAFAGCLQR